MGSRLVFNLTLLCLLVVNIVTTDLTADYPTRLIGFTAIATVVMFLIFHYAVYDITTIVSRGAFV